MRHALQMLDAVLLRLPGEMPAPGGWEFWRVENWGPWLATRLLHSGFYLLGAILLDTLWRSLLRRIKARAEEKDPATRSDLDSRLATLVGILRRVGTFVLYGAVLLLILGDFGLQIGPLLAGLGIAGVAVGFGAQYLIQDWIAGFFTVLEDQYRVGDMVQVGTFSGTVERVDLRTTHLRGLNGELHIVQNGTIRAVTNLTREWSRAVLDAGVDYRTDLGAAIEALREVGRTAASSEEVGAALLEPAEVLGVVQLGESQITVRLWVKTEPQRRWEVERFLRRAAVEEFARRGIEIPFPHRTVQIAGPPGEFLARGATRPEVDP